MQQTPGNQAVLCLTQLHRPSVGGRRDLVPILLGALAWLDGPLVAYGKRDPLADGRCHIPPRLACVREAPPRSRAAEVAISRTRRHIERDCPLITLRAICRGNKHRSGSCAHTVTPLCSGDCAGPPGRWPARRNASSRQLSGGSGDIGSDDVRGVPVQRGPGALCAWWCADQRERPLPARRAAGHRHLARTAVINACRSVCGPTVFVIPALQVIRRTIRPAPCRSSLRPSAARKMGPSLRSPMARSIAQAVRGESIQEARRHLRMAGPGVEQCRRTGQVGQ